MEEEMTIIKYPDPEDIARLNGKPDHISLTLWNEMDRVGVKEVPKGMNNRQFAEYLNQKYKETYPHRKLEMFNPEDF